MIRKAFTENSSSLIFPWRPHGHMASVSEATRKLQMLRMAVRVERMIRKSLNIFQIRNTGAIRRYIRQCVTGVLRINMQWKHWRNLLIHFLFLIIPFLFVHVMKSHYNFGFGKKTFYIVPAIAKHKCIKAAPMVLTYRL